MCFPGETMLAFKTFANSLDPDQARRRTWSWSKLFDTLMVFLKDFVSKKVDFEIYQKSWMMTQ